MIGMRPNSWAEFESRGISWAALQMDGQRTLRLCRAITGRIGRCLGNRSDEVCWKDTCNNSVDDITQFNATVLPSFNLTPSLCKKIMTKER